MQLKVRITQNAHLRPVKSFDLRLFADAKGCDEIAHPDAHKVHVQGKVLHRPTMDYLHVKLRKFTVARPADAIGTVQLHHAVANHALRSCTVFGGCEDSDRQNTPETIRAVNRNCS